MNTTTTTVEAAAQAGVTVATIRAWCRNGIIAAVKQAGRWVIDAASLTHRIAIGAIKTRKATAVPDLPFILTSDIDDRAAMIGVIGPADALRAAFETGAPITLGGKFAGERVYVGFTATGWDGRPLGPAKGLDYEMGTYPDAPSVHGACYLVDHYRLEHAPRVQKIVDDVLAEADAAQVAADAADDAYLNGYYE